ncbi:MAG: MFS transporter [Chloroflexi bacterium]|nr:MFS transporter [Chloroflexota bacterium]MDA1145792.1 MFS transporter [Chloroflexota bacterium]
MSQTTTPPTEDADLRSVLRNSQFRRIWAAGIFTSMMRWLDLLVLGVFTFDLTDSAGRVAIVIMVRMLPRLFFGVALGTLADRVNRKHLWVVALLGLGSASATLGALIASGEVVYWHILVAVFAMGTFWATEFPVRRALIADVVPDEAIAPAISIDWTTDSLNRMAGPALGGGLFVTVGAEGAYLLMGCVFLVAALVASTLRYTAIGRDVDDHSGLLQHFAGGLRYVRTSRLLIGALMVTVVFNIVFPTYQSMIPVIGKDVLGADPFRVGLMSATEGLGAVFAALWIANRATARSYARIYYFGTGLFLACALGFSQSSVYLVSSALLFTAGFGFSSFATMQTTILIRASAPAMRGRVLGVLSLAIGAGPLGALQVGPLVAAFGEQTALTIVVLEGIVMLAVVGAVWPMLRQPGVPTAREAVAPAP